MVLNWLLPLHDGKSFGMTGRILVMLLGPLPAVSDLMARLDELTSAEKSRLKIGTDGTAQERRLHEVSDAG
jgi:hypothetical protein